MGTRRTRSDTTKHRVQWNSNLYEEEKIKDAQLTFDEVDYTKNFLKGGHIS